MTIILNMCSYAIEEMPKSEAIGKYKASCTDLRPQTLLDCRQTEVISNIRLGNFPISLATVDIENFLQKMSTRS